MNSLISKSGLYFNIEIEFNNNSVSVESGVPVISLIKTCAEKSLGGIENLSGIPSTVGGAVVNNLGAFNECRELFKNSFKPADIKEEDFEKISAYYYSTMQDLKLEANKRNNAFPYTIEGVFEDDVTISAENAEFKIKLKNLTEMNTALQKDAVEIFGEEIKLN